MPEISVVIPAYNRAHILSRPINSLLEQNLTDWEVVIVDDGGSDDTENLLAALNDERFRYIRKDNGGPAAARQYGREHATGDVIVYLDSDDALLPQALFEIRNQLRNTGKGYGMTAHNRTTRFIDAAGQIIKEIDDPTGKAVSLTVADLYLWRFKTTGSGVFHTNDPRYDAAVWCSGIWIEDWEFLLQLAVIAPEDFLYIPEICVDYVAVYGGDGLVSKATYADYGHAFATIYELHKSDPLLTDHSVFTERMRNYPELHKKALAGEIPPPQYKYFPELWEKA